MRQKFRSLNRTAQFAIVFALILSLSIVAYAAISSLLTKSWQSGLTKGDVMEMSLEQGAITGTITPGESVAISPSITNTGTKDCLAFIKVNMPVYGSGANAYSFTVSSGWTKVSESSGEVIYGFTDILESDADTGALCNSMTMVDMTASEFKDLADVNVELTGYLADCAEYGTDVTSAWSKIAGGE